jgi:hypothetical protein
MPRKRKYDYQSDLPVTVFIKLPVKLVNDLENNGIDRVKLEKIVEKYLVNYVKKIGKKID